MYHPSGHHHHRSHPSSSARHPTDRESEQLPRLRDVLPEHFDSYRSHRGAYNFDNMNDALPSHSNSARLPPIHDSHSPPYRYQEATPRYHRDSSPPYSQPRGREIFNATHNPSSPTARNGAFHVLVPHQGIESGLVSISQSRHAARVNPAEASTSSSSSKKRFECHVCGRWMDRQSVYNQHMLTHTGERPYECTECPKAFNTKSNLNRHLLAHGIDKTAKASSSRTGGRY